jgi:hypothetical protein
MAYTTLERLKVAIGKESYRDDEVLSDLLTAAESVVDDHCGRRFTVVDDDASATSRVYVAPSYGRLLFIDDLADATGIVIVDDGTTLSASDYQLEPLNNVGPDRRYRPINAIRRMGVDWADPLYEGKASVTVTSDRWGWLTVDNRVARATEMAAKDLWDMRETRFGRAGFGEFAAVVVRQNQALADLLRPLVSHSPGWLPSIA